MNIRLSVTDKLHRYFFTIICATAYVISGIDLDIGAETGEGDPGELAVLQHCQSVKCGSQGRPRTSNNIQDTIHS